MTFRGHSRSSEMSRFARALILYRFSQLPDNRRKSRNFSYPTCIQRPGISQRCLALGKLRMLGLPGTEESVHASVVWKGHCEAVSIRTNRIPIPYQYRALALLCWRAIMKVSVQADAVSVPGNRTSVPAGTKTRGQSNLTKSPFPG